MVTLPFPAAGKAWRRRPSLSGRERLRKVPMMFPHKPKNCGGCEPLAEEPRARETADRVNLSRRFTPWHKATR